MSTPQAPHISVLLDEVITALDMKDGGVYVDATFGAGGYSRAMLQASDCIVYGIDRDPEAAKHCEALEKEFPNRVSLLRGQFGDMAALLASVGVTAVDGVAMDLGVSSMQLDNPERGFSFRGEGPLDMRMGQDGMTAADVVNTMEQDDLANIIYKYGEERASRKIAAAIVERRAEKPFERTGELASVVRSNVRKSKDGIDPATRTFQGLRIHVNDELGEIERGLQGAEDILKPGGRLAVVSFHSLEDRIVKLFLRSHSGGDAKSSRHMPEIVDANRAEAVFKVLKRSGVSAREEEIKRNPRSRSARLRWGIRLPETECGAGS